MKLRLAIAAFGTVIALSGVTALAATNAPSGLEPPDWLIVQAAANQ